MDVLEGRLTYETLPLVEFQDEEEEDDEHMVSGEKRISFGQLKWLRYWLFVLRLEDVPIFQPISILIFLIIWTIWQSVLQFWIGLEVETHQETEKGTTVYKIKTFGNPIWPACALYATVSYGFLFFYLKRHSRHFKGLTTKQFSVEDRMHSAIHSKAARNLFLAAIISISFFIWTVVKSIIAGSHYTKTKSVPFETFKHIPIPIFYIHIIVEPFVMLTIATSIFSCFLILDVLGWVHAIDVRVFGSQLIRAAQAPPLPSEAEITLPIHLFMATHQRIRREMGKTEKLWTPMVLVAIFFGSVFVIITFYTTIFTSKQFDFVTPLLLIPMFTIVACLYLLNLAYINKHADNIQNQLYFMRQLSNGRQSLQLLHQIDFFENYIRRCQIKFCILGITISYTRLLGLLFLLFELAVAFTLKHIGNVPKT